MSHPPSFLDRYISAVTSNLQSPPSGPPSRFTPLLHVSHVCERLEAVSFQGEKDVALYVDPVTVCEFKEAAVGWLENVVGRLAKTGEVQEGLGVWEDDRILAREMAAMTGQKVAVGVGKGVEPAGGNTPSPRRTEEEVKEVARVLGHLKSRVEALCFDIRQRTFTFNISTASTSSSMSIPIREVSVPGETFGLETWGAGLILSHLIATDLIPLPPFTPTSPPPTILDLGCGVGVAGIAAAKHLQKRGVKPASPPIFLTDYVPCVISNTTHNVHLTSTTQFCTARRLDWTSLDSVFSDPHPTAVQFPNQFDLIVASDVLYGDLTASLLPPVFARLLRRTTSHDRAASTATYHPRIHLLTPCRTETWSTYHAQFAKGMNNLGLYEVPIPHPVVVFGGAGAGAGRNTNTLLASSYSKPTVLDYDADPYYYQTDSCAHQVLRRGARCLEGAPEETWSAAMVEGYRWGEWRWRDVGVGGKL